MKIKIFIDKKYKIVKFNKTQIEEIVKNVLKEEGFKNGNLKINIITDKKIKEINKKFLNRDYYTDVITFNEIIKHFISGEIFISLDRVKENSEKYNKTLKEEFYRVLIHSILHLCDYKDYNKSEKIKIRKREEYYLKKLKILQDEI